MFTCCCYMHCFNNHTESAGSTNSTRNQALVRFNKNRVEPRTEGKNDFWLFWFLKPWLHVVEGYNIVSSQHHVLNRLVLLYKYIYIYILFTFEFLSILRIESINPFKGTWWWGMYKKIRGDCSMETMLISESTCKEYLHLLQVIVILLQGDISLYVFGIVVILNGIC